MIALAADHAGFSLKEEIKKMLEQNAIPYKDFGTHSTESVDYPDFAKLACRSIVDGECDKALLFCGTGIGMSMAANKIHGIRAAACSDYFSAKATRLHNDANVLCLGERVVGPGIAWELVNIFLNTEYEGERHARRVGLMMSIENDN